MPRNQRHVSCFEESEQNSNLSVAAVPGSPGFSPRRNWQACRGPGSEGAVTFKISFPGFSQSAGEKPPQQQLSPSHGELARGSRAGLCRRAAPSAGERGAGLVSVIAWRVAPQGQVPVWRAGGGRRARPAAPEPGGGAWVHLTLQVVLPHHEV